MTAFSDPTLPYALALFGYGTSIFVVGLNMATGWPKSRCREDALKIRKTIACIILAFGSLDQIGVATLLFLAFPGNTLQATTFGVFGVLWLSVFLVEFFDLDSRILAPIMLIFALYTVVAGYWFLISGTPVTAFLIWSASVLNLLLFSFHLIGRPRRITGIVGIENAIVAYYLVYAMITASQFGQIMPI